MQTSRHITIPGITSKGFEFYGESPSDMVLIHNRSILPFEKSPKKVIEWVKSLMPNPSDNINDLKSFVFDRWGRLDSEPDFNEDGTPSEPEFSKEYPCFPNGAAISPAQYRVLEILDLTPSVIAETLFISRKTVDRHIEDMVKNGGFTNAKSLAVWATKKEVII
jgi:DNA-binding CsgD family transcriptional regulator